MDNFFEFFSGLFGETQIPVILEGDTEWQHLSLDILAETPRKFQVLCWNGTGFCKSEAMDVRVVLPDHRYCKIELGNGEKIFTHPLTTFAIVKGNTDKISVPNHTRLRFIRAQDIKTGNTLCAPSTSGIKTALKNVSGTSKVFPLSVTKCKDGSHKDHRTMYYSLTVPIYHNMLLSSGVVVSTAGG